MKRPERWELTRGIGPFKQFYTSVCSAHRHHDDACELCNIGSWSNLWSWTISWYLSELRSSCKRFMRQ